MFILRNPTEDSKYLRGKIISDDNLDNTRSSEETPTLNREQPGSTLLCLQGATMITLYCPLAPNKGTAAFGGSHNFRERNKIGRVRLNVSRTNCCWSECTRVSELLSGLFLKKKVKGSVKAKNTAIIILTKKFKKD
jgi:hypothetical protein